MMNSNYIRVVIIFLCWIQISETFLSPVQLTSKVLGFSYRFQNRRPTTNFLKVEDILDDDEDFLELLRRQMNNPLNASPREVTNRIKSFFSNTERIAEEVSSFKVYIDANKKVMDVVNAILILEGSTKYGIPLKDICSWNILLEAMEKPSPLLSSSMVYRGVSSLKKLKLEDPSVRKFLNLLWKAVKEANVIMNPIDVCASLYNVQSLTSSSVPEMK